LKWKNWYEISSFQGAPPEPVLKRLRRSPLFVAIYDNKQTFAPEELPHPIILLNS